MYVLEGFPGGAMVESACQRRRHRFHPWVGKIPWKRKRQPTPGFFAGESHGQRRLVGYSPNGHKELDTTEQLHTHKTQKVETCCHFLWVSDYVYNLHNIIYQLCFIKKTLCFSKRLHPHMHVEGLRKGLPAICKAGHRILPRKGSAMQGQAVE